MEISKVKQINDISLGNLLQAMDEKAIAYDRDLMERAYECSKNFHGNQLRKSGESYFVHPVNVGFILIDLNMDQETIIAGLLHDILEDTMMTDEEMVENFGEEITDLVEGVTKITNMPFKSKAESQAGNLRKMIMAMSKDIRVIIIKLADRLHNMRTLQFMPEHKQYEKSMETLEIYAPLAHRLGISAVKSELEDLSLSYINNEAYTSIKDKINMSLQESQSYLDMVMEDMRREMLEAGIDQASISGRPKHIYSVYNKMKKQEKTLDEIYDLLGIRVIVDTVKECYTVLGIVHQLWKPIPGRFKDYIAMPKANMYQSIHSTVIGPRGKVFEIQIRTHEMHRIAEYGIAAHWQYKESQGSSKKSDEKFKWVGNLLEWQQDVNDPEEFLDTVKDDFFADEVYVFSPKGDVVGLSSGSIPIDFAYSVHSAVGNNCVGAKVNGKMVPLDTKLKNGDIVEIITSANSNGPSKDWLDIVKSSSAKQKIRQFFKKTNRSENIAKGRNSLEKEVSKQGFEFSEFLKENWIQEIAQRLSFKNVDDLYASIGYGTTPLTQIIPKLKQKYKDYYKPDLTIEQITQEAREKAKPTSINGIIIEGIDNIKVSTAKCCNPVPGDEILGYITKGRGLSVHRTDCPNLENIDLDRTIDVRWDEDSVINYNLHLSLLAYDRPGYVSDLTRVLGEYDINIESMAAEKRQDNTFMVDLILNVNGQKEAQDILSKIKKVQGTVEAYRVKK